LKVGLDALELPLGGRDLRLEILDLLLHLLVVRIFGGKGTVHLEQFLVASEVPSGAAVTTDPTGYRGCLQL
jgi:hypothetical protein